MPWPLEWSVVIISAFLVGYGIWLGRTVTRLERIVRKLEVTTISIEVSDGPSTQSGNVPVECGAISQPGNTGVCS